MNVRRRQVNRRRGPGWREYILALSLTVTAGLGVGIAVGQSIDQDVPLSDDPTAIESPEPPRTVSLLPRLHAPMNILLMATDVHYEYRQGKRLMDLRGNTDTMLLARVEPTPINVRVLSIPRDTRVPIPGHGTFKINAANPYGGPTLSAQVVANLLNVPVDRYVLINTRAVVKLVDEMGGVDLFVPKNLHYDDNTGGLHIHLRKGNNHLSGQAAHDFLRFRHDELGDIGRVQRQQMFLQALVQQYFTPTNLLKTPQLLATAKENLETNLSNEELIRLVTTIKDIDRDKVWMTMVPGVAGSRDGVSYWLSDPAGTERVVSTFLTGQMAPEARLPNRYRVAIRDGIGNRQGVRALKSLVTRAGYGRVDVDGLAAQLGLEKTQIIAQNADVAGAEVLAATLGVGQVVVAATGNIYSDFTVVIGRDWKGDSPH